MADVDAANTPTLSEQYFLTGKGKPVEEDVKTPVTTNVEETVAEAAVSAVEESPAVVESSDSATAVGESSENSVAASVESSEATPAASTEDTPAAEAASGDDSPATEEAGESTESETAGDQEAAEDDAPKIKIETAPADFRFPTTNQTRHCFTRYVEYHRCIAAKGDDAPECQKFAKYYRSLCPGEWIDRWNEQRENGTFPGPL